MERELFLGCGAASGLGLAVNVLVVSWRRRLQAVHDAARSRAEPSRRRSSFDHPFFLEVLASQLWTYGVSMLLQVAVYPACVAGGYAAWRARAGGARWVDRPGGLFAAEGGLDLLGLRLFLYAFFGHLVRDLPFCWGRSLIVVHHLVCMLGVLAALVMPVGGVSTALGIFALESGSLGYNAWCIDETLRALPSWVPCWPRGDGQVGRALVPAAFRVGMTASNLFGAHMLTIAVRAHAAQGSWAVPGFYGLAGTVLLAMRQQECFTAEKPGPSIKKLRPPSFSS